MMEVQVTLYGGLALAAGVPSGERAVVQVAAGSTVGDLMAVLKLSGSLPAVVFHNGTKTDLKQTLHPGDHVLFIPPVTGGG